MSERVQESGLQVAKSIHELVNQSILPGTGITARAFWSKFAGIVERFAPINSDLLGVRDDLQAQIDAWHKNNTAGFTFSEYKAFLQDIGYLVPQGDDFAVTPENVDTEITDRKSVV